MAAFLNIMFRKIYSSVVKGSYSLQNYVSESVLEHVQKDYHVGVIYLVFQKTFHAIRL